MTSQATDHSVRLRLEAREESLSPHASRARSSRGRDSWEEPSPLRTDFQRDRDRIIHTKAFRRLKHKTQVFISPLGDHYMTRLTHTLEVSQIARTIARALNLNEDLAEAISLGHDLGHTPFGHVGEEVLAELSPPGFRHSQQSLRIVEVLEKDGQGLNLTWEVRHGITNHSKPRSDIFNRELVRGLSLEGQVVRLSDAIAYLNHDIGDAIRAGALKESDLPASARQLLGDRNSQRIDTMVTDVVEASWEATGNCGDAKEPPTIAMSPRIGEAVNSLRDFMFENVYLPASNGEESNKSREVLAFLYNYFLDNPDRIPEEYWKREEHPQQMTVDYVSGMTDWYALATAEGLCPGISGKVFARML